MTAALAAHPALWLLALFLLLLPAFASGFVLVEIFGWALILGMIALSLMFLAGYGGMVSLVQMSVAGCAGYMVAIFGTSAVTEISLGWPWWLAILVAILIAVVFGTLSGALAVRTEGIYTIMITLAIASAFYYFVHQNYTVFNGFSGFNAVRTPQAFGVEWRAPVPFYYLTLFWAAIAYLAVVYVARSPFGLALQGTRDNARRMAALGFNVIAHRIAAYAFAALIAAVAGVLLVWHGGQISPGTAGIGPGDRYSHHRRGGWPGAADRAVHRRAHLRHPAHLCPRRPRSGRPRRQALPALDRGGIPPDRAVLAGRRARLVVALA